MYTIGCISVERMASFILAPLVAQCMARVKLGSNYGLVKVGLG